MATQNELDRVLVGTLLKLEFEVNQQLDVLAGDLDKALAKATTGNKVAKIKQFETQAEAILNSYFDGYTQLTATYSGAVASYKGLEALKTIRPIFAKFGHTNTLQRMEKKQAGYDVYYQAKLKTRRVPEFGGYTFTEKMKTLKTGTSKVVRGIVQNEVKKGTSAKKIAKKIQLYVKPTGNSRVAPYEVMRQRLGRVPRGVPSGSIQHNAIRIARTETAYTYRQATIDYYSDEQFTKGFKWVLSNRHSVPDICNEWASKSLYKKDGSDLPAGHPNCVCDTQVVTISQADMKKLGLD